MPGLSDLLYRLQHDFEFLLRFKADPDAAVEGYGLTKAQRAGLIHPDRILRNAIEGAGVRFGRVIGAGEDEPEPPSPEPEPPSPEPPSPEPEPPSPEPEPPSPEPPSPEPEPPSPEPPSPEPEPPSPEPEPPSPEPPSPEPEPPSPEPVPFPFDPNWPPAPAPSPPILPDIGPPPVNDYKVIVKIWPLGTRQPEVSGDPVNREAVAQLAQRALKAHGVERLNAIQQMMEEL